MPANLSPKRPPLRDALAQILATAYGRAKPNTADLDAAAALLLSDELQSLKTWLKTYTDGGATPPADTDPIVQEFIQYA